jgi:hypothetical protein
MRNTEQLDIEFPEGMLDVMMVIDTIVSPVLDHIAILIMGEHYYPTSNENIARNYLLEKNLQEVFIIKDELQAFQFLTYKSAQEFVSRLPSMSAFELMLAMSTNKNIFQ